MPDVVEGEDGKKPLVREIEVIKFFQPLHEWETSGVKAKLTARVIKIGHRIFLDLREYQEGSEFTGFTKRGLRLSLHEIQILESFIFPDAKALLRRRTTAPSVGEQACTPLSATDAKEVTPQSAS